MSTEASRTEAVTVRKGWTLAAMSLGFAMTAIDATIVSVALPTIQRELDLSSSGRTWIVNAYLLVLAVSIAIAGKLGDVFGSRRVFLTGLGVFTGMSALCGFAAGGTMLILSRAAQGFGGALITPTSQAVVTGAWPEKERGKALGIYAGVAAAGIGLGPILGGALTEFVSWRAIFLVNVPVGIATWLLVRYARPPETEQRGERLDWVGLTLLVLGLGAVIVALMESQAWGGLGSPPSLAVILSGVAVLVVFVFVELRRSSPLLELRIFRDLGFVGDNVVMVAMRFGLFGISVFAPIFTQDVLGFSSFQAGLATLPSTIMLFLVSPPAGKLYDRLGARLPVALGLLLSVAAFAWMAAFAIPKQSYAWMVPALVVVGVGLALSQSPSFTDAMNAAPDRVRGQAAGLVGTGQQLGGTLGVGVLTAIITPLFISSFVANLAEVGIHTTTAEVNQRMLAESGGGGSFGSGEINAAKDAFSSALATSYWVVAGLLAVAMAVAVALIRPRKPGITPPERIDHVRKPSTRKGQEPHATGQKRPRRPRRVQVGR